MNHVQKMTQHTLIIASLFTTAIASASTLDFTVDGIKDGQGQLYVQIFKGADNYRAGKAHGGTMVEVKASSATLRFSDLTAGEYAIRFFHDQDSDGKMATNLFGIPTEGFGFSNNAKIAFGPPSFDEMKITITETDTHISTVATVVY